MTDLLGSDYSEAFERVWSAYPRKVAKFAAWTAFVKLKAEQHTDQILSALAWQSKQPAWLEQQGKYVPHFSTYLHDHRWEDEPFHVTTNPVMDWFLECKQLHHGECLGQSAHRVRMALEASGQSEAFSQ